MLLHYHSVIFYYNVNSCNYISLISTGPLDLFFIFMSLAVAYLALCEDNTDVCLYPYLLLCAIELLFTATVNVHIYKCGALKWAIYKMLIGYIIYTTVGSLIDAVWKDWYTHNISFFLIA